MEHGDSYARAREYRDVVTGLWDSWAEDAFVRGVESGIFFDPSKLHVLDHHGLHFSVRGPLNIARPVQGWPVIVQAGASEAGRQLAAETAKVIFGAAGSLAEGKAFYADIKARMTAYGRDPDLLKILPAAFVVVGKTMAELRAQRLDATSRSRIALTRPPRLMPGRCSALVPQISREAIPLVRRDGILFRP